ncbi:hypothetical protein GJAV_G00074180, partial [Gymnothorax javanicus]
MGHRIKAVLITTAATAVLPCTDENIPLPDMQTQIDSFLSEVKTDSLTGYILVEGNAVYYTNDEVLSDGNNYDLPRKSIIRGPLSINNYSKINTFLYNFASLLLVLGHVNDPSPSEIRGMITNNAPKNLHYTNTHNVPACLNKMIHSTSFQADVTHDPVGKLTLAGK